MERRRSPASFDTPASFSLSNFSTSLAQKIRAAKKVSAPEEEEKAIERAKAARFDDYLRRTAPGVQITSASSSTSNLESTTNAFLESLASDGAGFYCSSSSSSRRGSTHSTHSPSVPESRHSVTPSLGRRFGAGGGSGSGSGRGTTTTTTTTLSRRANVTSAASTLSLHPSSSSNSSIAANSDADSNYVTKSTLPPLHLRRFAGGGIGGAVTGVARLAPADHEGFSALRRLLRTLFQTDYNDAFFRDVREAAAFSRLALVDGKPVGAIACRIQENAEGDRYRPLEIMIVAMGVLQENRRQGIGSKLLSHVAETAYRNDQVGRLRLAVHKENSSAIKLYEKMGFQRLNSSHDVWTMAHELRASSRAKISS